MCLFKIFVTCGVISFKTCLVVQEEVLIVCEDEMEEEIRVRDKSNSGELFKNFRFCFHERKII